MEVSRRNKATPPRTVSGEGKKSGVDVDAMSTLHRVAARQGQACDKVEGNLDFQRARGGDVAGARRIR